MHLSVIYDVTICLCDRHTYPHILQDRHIIFIHRLLTQLQELIKTGTNHYPSNALQGPRDPIFPFATDSWLDSIHHFLPISMMFPKCLWTFFSPHDSSPTFSFLFCYSSFSLIISHCNHLPGHPTSSPPTAGLSHRQGEQDFPVAIPLSKNCIVVVSVWRRAEQ